MEAAGGRAGGTACSDMGNGGSVAGGSAPRARAFEMVFCFLAFEFSISNFSTDSYMYIQFLNFGIQI